MKSILSGAASLALGAVLTFALPAQAESDYLTPKMKKTVDTLIDKALKDDTAYKMVESLTTEVGPRLAGTEDEARARVWAMNYLKELNFSRIKEEPFQVRLWTRKHEHAEIVSPYPQKLHVTSLGNSVATPEGGVQGEVVRFETLLDLQEAPDDALTGKIAFVDEFMTRTQTGAGYRTAVAKRSAAAVEAAKRGAIASVIRSVGTDHHRFPHTGNMRYGEGVTPIPAGALSAPDADQLARALERGKVVMRMELDVSGGGRVGQAWEGEPEQMATSGNIIAEIPGRTDEIVIVGAHLDSWDLGTGAIDDGAGVGIVTAAAKLVGDLPGRPKRTIRVVLFGSEEVGLVGAKAYADQHADELDKHVIGAESDFGARKIWQFNVGNWGEDKLGKKAAIERVIRRLGVLPGGTNSGGGPDMTYIGQAGVPMAGLTQNGWDYFDLHHTSDDTFDKIDPAEMAQNVAVYAAFIYLASEMEGDFRPAAVE